MMMKKIIGALMFLVCISACQMDEVKTIQIKNGFGYKGRKSIDLISGKETVQDYDPVIKEVSQEDAKALYILFLHRKKISNLGSPMAFFCTKGTPYYLTINRINGKPIHAVLSSDWVEVEGKYFILENKLKLEMIMKKYFSEFYIHPDKEPVEDVKRHPTPQPVSSFPTTNAE